MTTPTRPVEPAAVPGGARILDRGYRRYEGPRTGMKGAVLAVVVSTVQRILGLRRSVWAKILPVLMIVVAYLPAVVFIGIVALSPNKGIRRREFGELTNILPTYSQYFGYIASAVILFVAFVAPEALCTDRRTGMIGLYLASPLRRDSYLMAKTLAVGAVLGAVTIGPPLLLLVAFVLQGNGPDGPFNVVLTLARIVLSGLAISAFYTALSLAAASLTDRKAFASAGLILAFLVSAAVSGTLISAAGTGQSAQLVNLFALTFVFVVKVHGEGRFSEVATAPTYAMVAAITLACAAIVRTRYQRLQVTR